MYHRKSPVSFNAGHERFPLSMASLHLLPHCIPYSSPSCSSSDSRRSSLICTVPNNIHFVRTKGGTLSQHKRRGDGSLKRSLAVKSTVDEVSVLDSPPSLPPPTELVSALKYKLLSAVSGLNRGLAASEDDLRKADSAAKELEAIEGPVNLYADIDKLQGRWKLLYSSAFSSRTLGGSRPGPPIGRLLPITLGQVFQRIDILNKDFDNIVELQLGVPWPLQPVDVTATLAHKFEIIGNAKIKIVFEKTTVKTTGSFSQLPPFEVPRIPDQFRPPSNTGSGEFEVTYLDDDTRITRGDRGELRVFVIS